MKSALFGLLAVTWTATYALAQTAPPGTAGAVPPTPLPTVTFTRAELAEHDDKVGTMAVLNYLAQQAGAKAAGSDEKIKKAFEPKAPDPAAVPAK